MSFKWPEALSHACCTSLRAGVNGWISRREDFKTMWQGLEETDAEIFAVVWETKARSL